MPWVYVQKTGSLYRPNRKLLAAGYSGHGLGLNNPAWQDHIGVGPLPVGRYTIGQAHEPIDHLGPLAFPLVPFKTNDMLNRSGFFLHGDNHLRNHTASNGCIVEDEPYREEVGDSEDRQLVVVAQESDVAAAFVTISGAAA